MAAEATGAGEAEGPEVAGSEGPAEQVADEPVPAEGVAAELGPAEQLPAKQTRSEDAPADSGVAGPAPGVEELSEAAHWGLICQHGTVQHRGTVQHGWQRGLRIQASVREHERRVRERAAAMACWAMRSGARAVEVAACLRISPRTLRHWRSLSSHGGLKALRRGRPALCSPLGVRWEVLLAVSGAGRGSSVATVRKVVPKVSRAELTRTLKRCWRVWRLRYGWGGYRLTWQGVGSVWAMDFVLPSGPVDDLFPCVLSICDLPSRFQLLWRPMAAETAEVVVEALRGLFVLHGPPLVLKSDNGPPFIAETMAEFLAEWQVTSLFSPVCRPWYNGICERANGLLSVSTTGVAAAEGHPEFWTSANVERARHWHNEVRRPVVLEGRTPAEAWDGRVPLSSEERETFLRSVEARRLAERVQRGHAADEVLDHAALAAIDRVAVRDALCDLEYLKIRAKKSGKVLRSKAWPCLGATPAACALATLSAIPALAGTGDAAGASPGPLLAPGVRDISPGTDANAWEPTPDVSDSPACGVSSRGPAPSVAPPVAPPAARAQPPCFAGEQRDLGAVGQENAARRLAFTEPSGKLQVEAAPDEPCASASGPVHVGLGLFHHLRRLITPLIDRWKAAKIP